MDRDRGVDGKIVVVVSSDVVTLIDDDSHCVIGVTQHVHNYHNKSIHPLQCSKLRLIMHGIHVDIENDVIGSIRSFSSNNPIDRSHMQDLIASSWGRSSATCSTHSGYHFPEMDFLSSPSPFHATYMIPKPRDLTKVEAVVPLFDAESHSVGYNRLILPMRHIPTQGVWWNDPREYTTSVVLDLLSPNYDTLPFHDEMDSFASRINLSCPPSRSHSNQITSSITNPNIRTFYLIPARTYRRLLRMGRYYGLS